jgi:hypothetical protein
MVTVTIPSFKLADGVTVYAVSTSNAGAAERVAWHRFQEFGDLRADLKALAPELVAGVDLPSKILGTDPAGRMPKLEVFVRGVNERVAAAEPSRAREQAQAMVEEFLSPTVQTIGRAGKTPATSGARAGGAVAVPAPAATAAAAAGDRDRDIAADDFIFVKVLGTGASGRVVLSRHRVTRQLFALKILDKQGMSAANKKNNAMERRLLEKVGRPACVCLRVPACVCMCVLA